MPPHSPLLKVLQYGAPALLVGGLGYGYVRAFRRFPKTVGLLGFVAAGTGAYWLLVTASVTHSL